MSAGLKESSKNIIEIWGDNALDKSDEYLSSNYTNHQMPDASGGTSSLSLQEWRKLLADFHAGFSDVKSEVLSQVAEGDIVCSRWRMTAVHSGEFASMEPTGKTTSWTGVQTDRYESGKLVESWVNWDKFSFLEGLGLVSSP